MNVPDFPIGIRQQLLDDIATYGRCYWNDNGERLNPIVIDSERLFTPDELAEYLRVHRATVYRLPIQHVVVGKHRRYMLKDVLAYLEANRGTKTTSHLNGDEQ